MTKPRQIDFDSYIPFLLVSASNSISRSASRVYLSRFGIGVTEWRVLANLRVTSGTTAREICEMSSLDKAAVSRAAAILMARGLIAPTDRRDGRERPLELTAQGKNLHDQVIEVALARQDAMLAGISQGDRLALIRILKILRVNAKALDDR